MNYQRQFEKRGQLDKIQGKPKNLTKYKIKVINSIVWIRLFNTALTIIVRLVYSNERKLLIKIFM